MTPEALVQASSLYGQIDDNTLLTLAYTLLDQNPLATPDEKLPKNVRNKYKIK